MSFFRNIKEIFKINYNQNKFNVLAGFLALSFFIFCSLFIAFNQSEAYARWSSPDETANYYFTRIYSETGRLSIFEESGLKSSGWTSPRSMRSDFGELKPVSFPGIILIFGTLAYFFSSAIIPFLTPLFAAFGILIFYFFIRRLFDERVAIISAFLLSFFPVYIYYSIRAMFHNVLFIVLLLAGFYLLSLALGNKKIKDIHNKTEKRIEKIKLFWKNFVFKNNKKRWSEFLPTFFAGTFFGLAIITRTSEILWLLPSLFILWLFYARRFGLIKLLLFLSGLILGCLPAAFHNQILYGSFLYGGYNELNSSINELSAAGSLSASLSIFNLDYWFNLFEKLKDNVFYFGFKPLQSWHVFKAYIVSMFPFIFWPAVLGSITLISAKFTSFKKKHIAYLVVPLFFSAFLILYYGSWQFFDNPDASQTTIGNSYTRYWLAIYIWLMPLTAFFLIRFSKALFSCKLIKNSWRRILSESLQALLVFIYIISSLFFVLFGSSEGLVYWKHNNQFDYQAARQVFSLTEDNSIIISRYHDKLLFPFRRVIVATFPDDALTQIISPLVSKYPIYYYHFNLPEKDLNYLNDRRLPNFNLQMQKIKQVDKNFTLYKISPLTPNSLEASLDSF